MKKVIITGANGFIGKNLSEFLIDKDITVYAVDKEFREIDETDSKSKKKIFIRNELVNISVLPELITDRDIDVIYHLAWDGVNPEMRNDFSKQILNISYCIELVKAAKIIGVKRVIFLGSTMEFIYNSIPIDENAIPTPQNAYGSAKVASRYLSAQLANDLGLDFIYGIVTSVYGKGREDNSVIHYTIKKLLNGEKPSLSKLEQKWDFIHINDLVNALYLIGKCTYSKNIFPIGRGDNFPLKYYINIIRDLIDEKLPLGIGDVPYTNNQLPSSCINPQLLNLATGFVANIDFETGIKEVIDYYKNSYLV